MKRADEWIFVDDRPDEAAAFADQFGHSELPIFVRTVAPSEFRDAVLSGKTVPAGVLMDVDLSSITGEHGSGPGIAQDIRVKQRAGTPAFPVVRFAWRENVDRNVGGDTSSNDLFDLKIQKEDLRDHVQSICRLLLGVAEIYDAVSKHTSLEGDDLQTFLGLRPEQAEEWLNSHFVERIAVEREIAPHSAALLFIRTVLMHTGQLIDECVLAARLGVDFNASDGWMDILKDMQAFQYAGAAGTYFDRWWAQGIETWWYESFGAKVSLHSLSIAERLELIGTRYKGIRPLEMQKGSAGDKPWTLCQLSIEETPPRFVVVDPTQSVRIVQRGDMPPWVEQGYVSLGEALASNDKRLNREDLGLLSKRYRGI